MDWTRRPTRLQAALGVVAGVVLTVGFVSAVTVSTPTASIADVPPVTTTPTTSPVPPPTLPLPSPSVAPGETEAADANGRTVQLFENTSAPQPFKVLTNPTVEGVPLVLAVLQNEGQWLKVRVNIRPNGATAWVRRTEVNLRSVPNRIVVELGVRRLTVLHGDDVLAQHSVAIGAPSGPTPTGEFYIDATVHIANESGPYGVGQLSVSGFSDVYQRFGRGVGQIAIHGTNNPKAIGGTVSHGCLRLLNSAWTEVAAMAPDGTPVSIRP